MSTSSGAAISDALEQLRLKLLDLTGRNRLINYKHTLGKSLQFVQGQPAALYQRLVESNNKSTVSILGLPEPARREWTERNGRIQRPEPRDWAKAEGIPTSYDIPAEDDPGAQVGLRALMYPDDLAKHCRKIEREAVLAIEETGANMLFLVLGSPVCRSARLCPFLPFGGQVEVRDDVALGRQPQSGLYKGQNFLGRGAKIVNMGEQFELANEYNKIRCLFLLLIPILN